MMKRNALQAALLAAVMGVVSMSHTVLAADAPSEAAAAVNTWIGYQLRDDAGQYLTVANGAAETGSRILSYAANGVAAYNIWYFTETGTGTYTLRENFMQQLLTARRWNCNCNRMVCSSSLLVPKWA